MREENLNAVFKMILFSFIILIAATHCVLGGLATEDSVQTDQDSEDNLAISELSGNVGPDLSWLHSLSSKGNAQQTESKLSDQKLESQPSEKVHSRQFSNNNNYNSGAKKVYTGKSKKLVPQYDSNSDRSNNLVQGKRRLDDETTLASVGQSRGGGNKVWQQPIQKREGNQLRQQQQQHGKKLKPVARMAQRQDEDDEGKSASHVKHSSTDLQVAAGHHHGHHDHYYQHVEVPKKKAWKFGFKRGNHKHTIERHEKGYKNKFHSSFKWHAKEKCKKKKKCESKGKMTWHYEHHDKKHHG